MRRKRAAPVFKPYIQNQVALLPPSYEELIPAGHLVRVVNQVIKVMDLNVLLKRYEGGGRSSYHPKMMLKVLVYGYCEKIYSSRKIAKACSSIRMLVLGMSAPYDKYVVSNVAAFVHGSAAGR